MEKHKKLRLVTLEDARTIPGFKKILDIKYFEASLANEAEDVDGENDRKINAVRELNEFIDNITNIIGGKIVKTGVESRVPTTFTTPEESKAERIKVIQKIKTKTQYADDYEDGPFDIGQKYVTVSLGGRSYFIPMTRADKERRRLYFEQLVFRNEIVEEDVIEISVKV
jgi:hypothetical protein